MKKPDFIGDAAWLLAWRIFEAHCFTDQSGWHRTCRANIVLSNDFQGVIAERLGLKPCQKASGKEMGTALEMRLGEIEDAMLGAGVRYGVELLGIHLDCEALTKSINASIESMEKQKKRCGHAVHPKTKISTKLFKSVKKIVLEELF